MLLEGKKALITGSRRGIGRGIAVVLANEGADIGINDIERDQAAEDTMEMVRGEGRKVSWHLADITKSADVNRMMDEFVAEHGRIDILVNNAMIIKLTNFLAITEEEWDSQVGVDLKGYFLCSQRAAQQMVEQGEGGRIVSIASVHAFRAWPTDLVYAVCKAGVVRMAETMALELAGHKINCNCIAPGYIDSRLLPPEREHLRGGAGYVDQAKEWIPAGRGGVPEDIAKAVVFLCSSLGDYVNGECIKVDGGFLVGGTPPLE